ncbi:MAG TPA: PQQ-binding-like beta-propeller repeat protein [Steroidobacteraceae bacterium]|nr:PQQ-binding-like beta-propeller repeat protein [Steroidobacteraceae bacterium]
MRHAVTGLVALLFSCVAPAAFAAEGAGGEQLFGVQCALCHMANPAPRGSPNEKAPTRAQLHDFPAEAVLAALTDGKMKLQGSPLSDAQKRMVAEYVTGKTLPAAAADTPQVVNPCAFKRPMRDPAQGAGWNGHGNGPAATRFQDAKAGGITAADLPRLKLKWAFGYAGVAQARTQPTLAGGRLFIASENGEVHALDPATGCTFWTYKAQAGVRTAPAVAAYKSQGHSGYVVVVGDTRANLYGIDADTGRQLWTAKVDTHPVAGISGSPIIYDGRVFIGVQGISEEGRGNTGGYACCTFRGSLSAFDVASGKLLWKTYTIDEPQPRGKSKEGVQMYGPAGGSIWSAPSIDVKRGLVYAATGNNYADPPQPMTDAVIAFDQKTGAIRWYKQLTAGDAWVMNCQPSNPDNPACPATLGPDYDFSATPILTHVGKRDLLVLPQKSGVAYAIDADKQGELVWKTAFGKPSGLGGQWGGAVDGVNFYTGTNGFQSTPGGFTALRLTDGSIAWQQPPQPLLCDRSQMGCVAGQGSAATAIPGAVFSGGLDGGLRAYATGDGRILWTFDTNRSFDTVNGVQAKGGSMDGPGPIVANGMLFVNSGYGGLVGHAGNVLLAFALE